MAFSGGYFVARDAAGQVVSGAELRVYKRTDAGADDGLATLVNEAGDDYLPQPIVSGADGVLAFWANPAAYNLVLTHGAVTRRRNGYLLAADPAGANGKFLQAWAGSTFKWETPAGGGGGGGINIGATIALPSSPYQLTWDMVTAGNVAIGQSFASPASLNFWTVGAGNIGSGIMHFHNYDDETPVLLNSPASAVLNAAAIGTHVKPGGAIQIIGTAGLNGACIVLGDTFTP